MGGKIIFQKIRNPDNNYDLSDIKMEVEGECTLDQLYEEFGGFLAACSYSKESIKVYNEEAKYEKSTMLLEELLNIMQFRGEIPEEDQALEIIKKYIGR